jgi:predicted ATPase
MLEGIAGWRAVGAQTAVAGFLSGLLQSYLKAGHTDEAEQVLAEALEVRKNTGERHFEAELHRLKGELLRMQDSDVDAEQSFRTAIRIAQSKSAKSFELRAATGLARLLARQGKRDEARTMLAEIYGWFTEGFGTRDLKDAKALLDELSG